VPLTAICNREYTDPRQRQLFKNIMYVGALSALLDMDVKAIEQLISEQFKGKEKLFDANKNALHLGRDWALLNLECPIGLRLQRSDKVGDRIFMEGNSAAALGPFMAARPSAPGIRSRPPPRSPTPSPATVAGCGSIPKPRRAPSRSFRARTSSPRWASSSAPPGTARAPSPPRQGPGVSLMTEFLGLAYFAEIPAVLFNVQRAGPSTGMPTRTQQCDIISCAYASHGDTKHVLLFPRTRPRRSTCGAGLRPWPTGLQTPIFVMLDLDIGMNHRLCRPLTWDDSRKYDRGKVMTAEMLEAGKEFGRYLDVDGDGIPVPHLSRHASRPRAPISPAAPPVIATRAIPRKARPMPTTCSGCCASSRPPRISCPRPLMANSDKPTRYGVIYYGSTAPAMDEANLTLKAAGKHLDLLRVRAFPFHHTVEDFIADHDFVFVVEQNRDAQLRSLIVNECGIDPARLVPIPAL
jgi:2-oxoglutarate ferredoxin oxidoreductase subunit alpha